MKYGWNKSRISLGGRAKRPRPYAGEFPHLQSDFGEKAGNKIPSSTFNHCPYHEKGIPSFTGGGGRIPLETPEAAGVCSAIVADILLTATPKFLRLDCMLDCTLDCTFPLFEETPDCTLDTAAFSEPPFLHLSRTCQRRGGRLRPLPH